MMTFIELLGLVTGRNDLQFIEVVQEKDLDFDEDDYNEIMDDYDSMYGEE